ncbi:hypothetical protein CPLU01_10649 [Colletotrichum plurivorum]|uniref:Uncharacterized protein n=1 Tax=Colletotrichum plurivorum TaxID=2175906 RepID=A0A8H6K4W8_9PEZI|nr:hypothetical protein CPLU01_10649 [Colletotrichum plurivorum]
MSFLFPVRYSVSPSHKPHFPADSRLYQQAPRKSRKERVSRPKESSSKQQDRTTSSIPLSFLFVVNEFQLFDDQNGNAPEADRFGNPLPPTNPAAYGDERVGSVWRYENGVISPADNYVWYRPEPGIEGTIALQYEQQYDDGTGRSVWSYDQMEVHSTFSVFNCWRFLPCIWTDVDSSVEEMGLDYKWSQLEFGHDTGEMGVTRLQGLERHVAGKSPSWIPALLPETYAVPSGSWPQSRGLGGPFGIIIALIALSRRPGHTDEAFREGLWRNGRLTSGFSRSSRAEPDSKGPPRGVLVQICYDTHYNLQGSTFDAIDNFEQHGKAIAN